MTLWCGIKYGFINKESILSWRGFVMSVMRNRLHESASSKAIGHAQFEQYVDPRIRLVVRPIWPGEFPVEYAGGARYVTVSWFDGEPVRLTNSLGYALEIAFLQCGAGSVVLAH